jgi:hypothetical protein
MSDKNDGKKTPIHEGRIVVPVTRPGKTIDKGGVIGDSAPSPVRGHSTIPVTVIPPPNKKKN